MRVFYSCGWTVTFSLGNPYQMFLCATLLVAAQNLHVLLGAKIFFHARLSCKLPTRPSTTTMWEKPLDPQHWDGKPPVDCKLQGNLILWDAHGCMQNATQHISCSALRGWGNKLIINCNLHAKLNFPTFARWIDELILDCKFHDKIELLSFLGWHGKLADTYGCKPKPICTCLYMYMKNIHMYIYIYMSIFHMYVYMYIYIYIYIPGKPPPGSRNQWVTCQLVNWLASWTGTGQLVVDSQVSRLLGWWLGWRGTENLFPFSDDRVDLVACGFVPSWLFGFVALRLVVCSLWLLGWVACGMWHVSSGLWLVALWLVACGLWLVTLWLVACGFVTLWRCGFLAL